MEIMDSYNYFLFAVFAPLVPMIGYRAVLALSGYVLNNVAFVLAAVFLYRSVVVLFQVWLIL